MVIDGGGRKPIAIITLLMIINIFTITLLMTIIILTSRLLQPLALSPRPLLSRAFAVPVSSHSQRGHQHFDNDNHNHNHYDDDNDNDDHDDDDYFRPSSALGSQAGALYR